MKNFLDNHKFTASHYIINILNNLNLSTDINVNTNCNICVDIYTVVIMAITYIGKHRSALLDYVSWTQITISVLTFTAVIVVVANISMYKYINSKRFLFQKILWGKYCAMFFLSFIGSGVLNWCIKLSNGCARHNPWQWLFCRGDFNYSRKNNIMLLYKHIYDIYYI